VSGCSSTPTQSTSSKSRGVWRGGQLNTVPEAAHLRQEKEMGGTGTRRPLVPWWHDVRRPRRLHQRWHRPHLQSKGMAILLNPIITILFLSYDVLCSAILLEPILQFNLSAMIYQFYSKTLSEIRPGKELWKIKARMTRVWNAILLCGELISHDMILIWPLGSIFILILMSLN